MKLYLIMLLGLLWVTPAAALVISADTLWTGELSFSEDVRVLPGATLTIAPGSSLYFNAVHLEIAGRLVADDVVFSGQGWGGLLLKGSDNSTRLSGCVIKGAETGLLVQGGAPLLERLTLTDNKIGLELRGKAAGKVVDCRFMNNRKVGLFLKDNSTTEVSGSLFEKNGRYGAYIYHALPNSFQGNRFVGNAVALMIAYHGSDPELIDNRFEGNEVAIQVDRAARPVLRGNLLRGNQTGLYVYRRSDPLVVGNRFEKNQLALLVAYSSYPRIEGNDFAANGLSLKLEFQSSKWEEQRGEAARAGETSARSAFAGQGMRSVTEDDRRAKGIDGTVNATGNWWGEAGTVELAKIGAKGNPSFIHDGRDQATFNDAGETFPLDRVVYLPWSEKPLVGGLQ